jgi:GT2 family glycosyltransferase
LLETVGLLNEDYFLYYEEIDWFTRAGSEVRCVVAEGARLYHREGGSIGSPGWQRSRPSHTADLHVFRSKLLYMRRFYPDRLLRCYCSSMLEIGKRLLRGQFSNALVVTSALLGAGRAGRASG